MDKSRLGGGRDRLEADGTWIDGVEKEEISARPVITSRDPNSWAGWFDRLARTLRTWSLT